MAFSIIPDYVFTSYAVLTPEFLRARGVRLLLCDMDYTLAPRAQAEPDAALLAWVRALREGGVEMEVVSNNRSPRRVERFCRGLGVGFTGHAGKPSIRVLKAVMRRHGASAGEAAMLGDKLLTDTLAAKRAGILALMVEPKGGPKGAWNHVLHAAQEPFKRACPRDARNRLDFFEQDSEKGLQ